MSKVEGRTGSPEKPLSSLGALGYKNYWTLAVMRYLEHGPDHPRLEGECGLDRRDRGLTFLIRYQFGNCNDGGRRLRNAGAAAYDLYARTYAAADKAKPRAGYSDLKGPKKLVTDDHDTAEVEINPSDAQGAVASGSGGEWAWIVCAAAVL